MASAFPVGRYCGTFVRSDHTNLLGRTTAPPDPEINFWGFSDLDLTTIRVSFEASDEYFFHVSGFKP